VAVLGDHTCGGDAADAVAAPFGTSSLPGGAAVTAQPSHSHPPPVWRWPVHWGATRHCSWPSPAQAPSADLITRNRSQAPRSCRGA